MHWSGFAGIRPEMEVLARRSWRTYDATPATPSTRRPSPHRARTELHVETVLVTLTEARGGLPAGHTVWRA